MADLVMAYPSMNSWDHFQFIHETSTQHSTQLLDPTELLAELPFIQEPPIDATFQNTFQSQQIGQSLPKQSTRESRNRNRARKSSPLVKKPLNSYMAFRSFYSTLFPHLTQMAASAYLKLLWDEDPFKAKWAIIARAYTAVRDVAGRQAVPLYGFLAIVTPQMGVIQVPDYLAMMKWVSFETENGSMTLTQPSAPDLTRFPADILSTEMNEYDIVRFCYHWKAHFSFGTMADALLLLSERLPQQVLLAVPQGALHTMAPLLVMPAPPGRRKKQHQKQQQRASETAASQAVPSEDAQTTSQLPWSGCMADLYVPCGDSLDLLGLDHDQFMGVSNSPDIGLFHELQFLQASFPESWISGDQF